MFPLTDYERRVLLCLGAVLLSGALLRGLSFSPREKEQDLSVSAPVLNLININKASLEELILLPGIGKKTALEIIEFRNSQGLFSSPEDLVRVKGIGPAKAALIKERICF